MRNLEESLKSRVTFSDVKKFDKKPNSQKFISTKLPVLIRLRKLIPKFRVFSISLPLKYVVLKP